MRHRIETQNPISASAADVWAHIRTGEDVGAFLPIITACSVEGNRRFCKTAEGSLEETITRSDDEARVFGYRIDKQDVFPVENIAGEMRIEADGDGTSILHWTVEFDTDNEEVASGMKAQVPELYQVAAANLGQLATA